MWGVRPNRITIYERREGGSGVIEEIMKVLPEVRFRSGVIAQHTETNQSICCSHLGD